MNYAAERLRELLDLIPVDPERRTFKPRRFESRKRKPRRDARVTRLFHAERCSQEARVEKAVAAVKRLERALEAW